jgi:hypothetical protein
MAAVVDAREVFRLLLACVLGYAMYAMGTKLRLTGAKGPFALGYACIVVSYMLSIVEDLSPSWIVLHGPQHIMFVIAGAAFAVAAWRVRSRPSTTGRTGP